MAVRRFSHLRDRALVLVTATLLTVSVAAAQEACITERAAPESRVLLFSRTAGFRHQSIPTGVEAIRALGTKYGFAVDHTEDPAEFRDERLADVQAVVFLSTTGDVLDADQQAAFEKFVRGGGGFVGIHAAADTEHDWPWYGELVGGYFQRHPAVQQASIAVRDRSHISTRCLPVVWTRTDEWYDYKAQPPLGTSILATLDEGSYQGGRMGALHPIAWYREVDGGRAWYTGLGHTDESYAESAFLDHVAGGILWAIGK